MILLAGAGWASDIGALLEIALAIVLLGGYAAVRTGRIRLHRALQSAVVLANLPIVLIWMLPQYLAYVLPDLPSELGEPFYLVPTIMLVAGSVAEALGLYILVAAGTNWLPERFRFRRYKLWMRTEILLWWGVVATGLATYYVWYSGAFAS